MSLIAAIKKNGKIYLAADTQTTAGRIKIKRLLKESYKIHQFENGILIGAVGSVHGNQIVANSQGIFTLPEDGEFDKRYVVTHIIPKMVKLAKENNLFEVEKDRPPAIDSLFVLAYGDKIFVIDRLLAVSVIERYVAIGSGEDVVLAALEKLDNEDIKDDAEVNRRIVEGLRITSEFLEGIGAPFITIDTVSQEFVVNE